MIKYLCYLLMFVMLFFGAFAGLFLKKDADYLGQEKIFSFGNSMSVVFYIPLAL